MERRDCIIVGLRSPRSKAYLQVSISLWFFVIDFSGVESERAVSLFLQILLPRKYLQRRVLKLLFEVFSGRVNLKGEAFFCWISISGVRVAINFSFVFIRARSLLGFETHQF
jgi:hypothetical protein